MSVVPSCFAASSASFFLSKAVGFIPMCTEIPGIPLRTKVGNNWNRWEVGPTVHGDFNLMERGSESDEG